MRTGIRFIVTSGDRQRLQAIVADPKSSQKHVWRARIILQTDEGLGTSAIMRETGKSKTCVWRWQERFMPEGVNGLLRDKSRPPGKAPIPPERVAEIVRLTQQAPPHEAAHWTLRAMAKVAGVAASTVQAIWKAHGLSPHRWRHFKLSNDPAFAEKLTDIVGLYVDPPAHAVVLSVDEKSQIQALGRTQPGLPMKKGRAGTMTYDYKRHGTTTLFAALSVLDGTVIAQNMQRHRHQEFIHASTASSARCRRTRPSTSSHCLNDSVTEQWSLPHRNVTEAQEVKDVHHLTSIREHWYRLRAQAGLEDLRIHDLRHSFTTSSAPTSVLRHVAGKPNVSKKARLRSFADATRPSKDIT